MQITVRYADSFRVADTLEAYERLLLDAMLGDQSLFARSDAIERLWQSSAPLLDNPPPLSSYAPVRGARSLHLTTSLRPTAGTCQTPALVDETRELWGVTITWRLLPPTVRWRMRLLPSSATLIQFNPTARGGQDMSSTYVSSDASTPVPDDDTGEMKLEVVVIPVSDVDCAKDFYQGLGGRTSSSCAATSNPRLAR